MQKLTLQARRLQPRRLLHRNRHFHTSTTLADDGQPRSESAPTTRAQRSRDSFRRLTLLSNSNSNPKLSRPQGKDSQQPLQVVHSGVKQRKDALAGIGVNPKRNNPRRDNSPRGGSGRAPASRSPRAAGSFKPRPGGNSTRGEASGMDEEDEEDADEFEDMTAGEILSVKEPDAFQSLDEAENYARTLKLIKIYNAQPKEGERTANDGVAGNGAGDTKPGAQKDELVNDFSNPEIMDSALVEAMENLVKVEDRNRPRHVPGESWSSAAPADALGDVPLGGLGMGNTLEESLQHIGRRTGNAWESPRGLAQRLTEGDLVKFSTPTEKREVLDLAETWQYDSKRLLGSMVVGFEPVQGQDKAELIKRTVSGAYQNENPAWTKLSPNAARILGGNASYGAAKRAMFMGTMEKVKPRSR